PAVVGRHQHLDQPGVDVEAGRVGQVVEVHPHPRAGLDLPVGVVLENLDPLHFAHRVGERVALDAARDRDPDVVEALFGLGAHTVASTAATIACSSSRSPLTCSIDSSTARAPGTFASSPLIDSTAASTRGFHFVTQPASTSRLCEPCSSSSTQKRTSSLVQSRYHSHSRWAAEMITGVTGSPFTLAGISSISRRSNVPSSGSMHRLVAITRSIQSPHSETASTSSRTGCHAGSFMKRSFAASVEHSPISFSRSIE